jgi:UDP-N-acetylglucosamine 4,6-dehydratase/5-epimerase
MNLNNKTILITGGTGSFGKNFTSYLLKNHTNLKKIIVFSRDELKQYEMKKYYINNKFFHKLRFFLGDIRDYNRLLIAFNNVDIVIHAAALKQVDTAEYNPGEFIKTNILGSQNVIEAAFYNNVLKIIALSTDKASSPINLYGATKLCSDKLFTSANHFFGQKKFSVVRYGNVAGSRGSVIPLFLSQKNKSVFNVTNKDMTRFNISMKDSIALVMWSIKNSFGGEIVVPKLPSYRLVDLVKAINEKAKINIIGIREGEKIHEEMISDNESLNVLDIGNKYIILPYDKKLIMSYYLKKFKAKMNKKVFSYNSGTNKRFLKLAELKNIINK